ncbi:hypothetical protein GCM10027341_30030 [Spirosoma knui]
MKHRTILSRDERSVGDPGIDGKQEIKAEEKKNNEYKHPNNASFAKLDQVSFRERNHLI